MGLPRITFNGKNVDFTRDVMVPEILPIRSRLRSESLSGQPETLNIASGFSVRIYLRNFSNSDSTESALKTALWEAAQWAESGQPWVFMRDSAVTVSTTTDGGVAAGDTSIPVTSATGIVSGSRYVLESAKEVAIVKATNTATDPATISPSVNAAFASGSRFRAFDYLPMLGAIRIIENPPLFWDVEISGTVDKRAL